MSKAAVVVRQSQGDDDSTSLSIQREAGKKLAEELDAKITLFDFGVHTGFSSLSDDVDVGDGIDDHPRMDDLLAGLRSGEYDWLLSYDDSRICRDGYYQTIKHAAVRHGAELVFVDDDVEEGTLGHSVKREVEKHIKLQEKRKSRAAVEWRQEQGYYQGGIPTGCRMDDRGEHLVPAEGFDDALQVLALKESGHTHRDVVSRVESVSSTGTVSNICERRNLYEQLAREHEVDTSITTVTV